MSTQVGVPAEHVIALRSVYHEESSGRYYRVAYTGCGQPLTYLCDIAGSRLRIREIATEKFRRISAESYAGEDRFRLLAQAQDPYASWRILKSDESEGGEASQKKWLGHEKKSESNWSLIGGLLSFNSQAGQDAFPAVLQRSTRTSYLSEYATYAGVKVAKIRLLLRLYLQRGMTANAVLSGYANCGQSRTNALFNAEGDITGILSSAPITKVYEKRPGRPPRRTKYKFAVPTEALHRIF
jgi:hypothetical protein